MPNPIAMPPALLEALVSSLGLSDSGLDPEQAASATVGLADAIPAFWLLYASKGYVSPLVQYLYVRRQAIDFLRGQVVSYVDTTVEEGGSSKLSQWFGNLSTLYEDLGKEIVVAESQAQAGFGIAVGQITAGTAQAPQSGAFFPGDSRYTGDPLKPILIIR